jgi:NAD(P)-dependent dehydrogenase (short-subunit alcohol dehydrogenase family)
MLDGKVALITGGSPGQGRAHAITSAREGGYHFAALKGTTFMDPQVIAGSGAG